MIAALVPVVLLLLLLLPPPTPIVSSFSYPKSIMLLWLLPVLLLLGADGCARMGFSSCCCCCCCCCRPSRTHSLLEDRRADFLSVIPLSRSCSVRTWSSTERRSGRSQIASSPSPPWLPLCCCWLLLFLFFCVFLRLEGFLFSISLPVLVRGTLSSSSPSSSCSRCRRRGGSCSLGPAGGPIDAMPSPSTLSSSFCCSCASRSASS
mmetsp:Transcript_15646/g.26212  ORF Transcript_15646/g.26212 Transcript_15646/m.26212 type:complete len:206 (+) Transcript_15646:538-1155(+)